MIPKSQDGGTRHNPISDGDGPARPRDHGPRVPTVTTWPLRTPALSLLAIGALAATAADARADMLLAQRSAPSALESEAASTRSLDIRRQGSDEMVSQRRELEASTELAFVTTHGPMEGVPQLSFTDLALWRLHAAITPLAGLRITASTAFLPKQPATLDEPFWQSAALGARVAIADWAALGADASFGKLMGDLGTHGSAALGFQARTLMDRYFIWEGSVGLIGTRLWPSAPTGTTFWFAEAGASGQFQLCWNQCDEHHGATWLGIDLAIPIYHHPGSVDASDPVPIDPRTRLGLTLGSFFNVNKTWDFYATLSWIDRGDPDVPSTQLPIVDGGFDQIQIAFGVIAHWWLEPAVVSPYPEPE
jgi:hypothetical protein